MSVVLENAPKTSHVTSAQDLAPGTWFCDERGDVYLVVFDDKSHERRVVCAGPNYPSFITDVPLGYCMIEQVLLEGTSLRIVNTVTQGGSHEKISD